MSKTDDMRQMRERKYAQREHEAGGRTESPAPPPVPESSLPPGSPKPGAAADEQGKCSVCGKVRTLANGVVTMHQKGFGKLCPGSRKAPA